MADQEKIAQYLNVAKGYGIDTANPRVVGDLIASIKYQEMRFASPKRRDYQIAQDLGITEAQLERLKASPYIRIATEIILADFLAENAAKDTRHELFHIFSENTADLLRHLFNVALGREQGVPYRDQVSAAREIINNPVFMAWLGTTFVGTHDIVDSQKYIELRQSLLENPSVVKIDEVVEGEVVNGNTVAPPAP